MEDWCKEEIERNQEERLALFIYTPLCGTCQLAGKMMNIVENTLNHYTYAKINLNTVPEIAETYQIESVPCLLLFEKGRLQDKIYAFHSVLNIFERMAACR